MESTEGGKSFLRLRSMNGRFRPGCCAQGLHLLQDFNLNPAGNRPGAAPRVVRDASSHAAINDDFWCGIVARHAAPRPQHQRSCARRPSYPLSIYPSWLVEVPVILATRAHDSDDQVAENLKRNGLSPLELAAFIRGQVEAGEATK